MHCSANPLSIYLVIWRTLLDPALLNYTTREGQWESLPWRWEREFTLAVLPSDSLVPSRMSPLRSTCRRGGKGWELIGRQSMYISMSSLATENCSLCQRLLNSWKENITWYDMWWEENVLFACLMYSVNGVSIFGGVRDRCIKWKGRIVALYWVMENRVNIQN